MKDTCMLKKLMSLKSVTLIFLYNEVMKKRVFNFNKPHSLIAKISPKTQFENVTAFIYQCQQ